MHSESLTKLFEEVCSRYMSRNENPEVYNDSRDIIEELLENESIPQMK